MIDVKELRTLVEKNNREDEEQFYQDLKAMNAARAKENEPFQNLMKSLGEKKEAEKREKMEAEIEEQKAKEEARIRKEAADRYGAKEWNDNGNRKAFGAVLAGLLAVDEFKE